MSFEEANELLQINLFEELDLDAIRERNPEMTDEEILQRYVRLLGKFNDPRCALVSDIQNEHTNTEILDNQIELLKRLSLARSRYLDALENSTPLSDELDGLSADQARELIDSVGHLDEEDIIKYISEPRYAVSEAIGLTAIFVNMTLLVMEHTHEYADEAQAVYDFCAFDHISGESMVNLPVIIPYLYQAVRMCKNLGVVNYFRFHFLHAMLNVAGVAELGFVGYEAVRGGHHDLTSSHIRAMIRSSRFLRVFRFLERFEGVREISNAATKALPGMVKIGGTFAGGTVAAGIILAALTNQQVEGFQTVSDIWDQLVRMMFNDDVTQSVMIPLREADSMSSSAKLMAQSTALVYSWFSTAIVFALGGSAVWRILEKDSRLEKFLALISEKFDNVIKTSAGVRERIFKNLATIEAALTKGGSEREEMLKLQRENAELLKELKEMMESEGKKD